ncbi:phosphopantetheine-binding protein, partial [Pseudomonas fildesensis]
EWVRETAVLAVDGKYLVGYLVLHNAGDDWRDVLGAHLGQHLPDYMVPAQWVLLEQMPLSPNGKLDRKALPKPDALQQSQAYEAPRSELEQQIADIWSQVLEVERVGRNDNFFEMGGHSLLVINVISRMQLELGLRPAPQDIFQHPDVGRLASHLEGQGSAITEDKLSRLDALFDDIGAF